MKLILKLAVNVFALLIVDYLLPGFTLTGYQAAIVTAVVIGVVNTFLRPILQLLALPISLFTFGIAAFLINVALLWGVAYFVPGFNIDTFSTAIIGSIILSLVSWFLNRLSK